MLNHSCDHNILKVNNGGKVTVFAARNIRQGEEITENYYPHFSHLNRIQRRNWLKEHYWFECNCTACDNDLRPVTSGLNDIKAHSTDNIFIYSQLSI